MQNCDKSHKKWRFPESKSSSSYFKNSIILESFDAESLQSNKKKGFDITARRCSRIFIKAQWTGQNPEIDVKKTLAN